jgi:beta-glucanase (GH16 family)
MKSIIPRLGWALCLILPLACASAPEAARKAAPPAPENIEPTPGRFTPMWSDEFDGPNIDASKWYVINRHDKYWPETPWRRNYKKTNAFIENGVLVLQTIRDGAGYSTACLTTSDYGKQVLFKQAFGSYETRLRFPKSQGHWCAFWLMNDDEGSLYKRGKEKGGRDGTEIDIIEKATLSDRAEHNLHWDGYADYHQSAGYKNEGLGLNDGEWHTVKLEWYPNLYIFYIDGKVTWRTNAGGVCQTPNYIILSEEIGNFGTGPEAWGGGPISEAALPDRFEVDYVRVCAFVPDKP